MASFPRRIRCAFFALALGLPGVAPAAELLGLAATSLSGALRDIGAEFEKTHGGARLVFSFAASDVLLVQLARGAPADIFASADEEAMNKAVAQGLVDPATRVEFARNRLVLVVPAGRPLPASLAQLAGASYRRIAIGSPASVPAGRYAKAALGAAGMWAPLEARVIMTQNVRQSLDYVARGECDAGFVYATDAATLSGKVSVAFDVPTVSPVVYPVAVVRASAQPVLASAFVDYLRSPAARALLARHGFGMP